MENTVFFMDNAAPISIIIFGFYLHGIFTESLSSHGKQVFSD
eukprot:UN09497